MSTTTKTFKTLSLTTLAVLGALALPQDAFARDNNRDGNRHDNGRHYGWQKNDHDDHRGNNDHWNRNNYRVVRTPQIYPRYVTPRYVYPNHYVYRPVVVYPRHYVGQRLVTYYPVPTHVRYRLAPVPRGYYYSYQDDNVFLVRQQDNVIAQIISLLAN